MPFVKLDCGILDSSLWVEPSDTRICWITMLAMADSTGFVAATAPGIARKACIPIEACRVALKIFESPDPDSRTQGDEGKRTQREDGGYQIVNYDKYREKDYTNAERQARHRAKRNGVTPVIPEPHGNDRNGVTSLPVTQAEAEAEAERSKALSEPKNDSDGFTLEPPKNGEVKIHKRALVGVFEHYLEVTGRSATVYTLTDTRCRQGERRLQECLKKTGGDIEKAIELMVIAVDALGKSDFHMGRDKKTNGKRYCEWEHVFRSYEQMEKWWNQE